jgi:hypothetical protein
MGAAMNLRLEFEKFLNKNGNWVALRKVMLNPRGQNVDSFTNEGDSSLNATTTSGYTYTDHLTLTRKSSGDVRPEMATQLGTATAARFAFYFRHNMNPKELDWVVELELDSTTREPIKPFKIVKYYDIQDVHEMRGPDGKIIYYKCLCESSVWNVD